MQFKSHKIGKRSDVRVYRKLIKGSHWMGNIVRANPKVFKEHNLFFYACGDELYFDSDELRGIADKMDEIKLRK